ncbi:hypothetical protein PR048_028396 [Dryococelus australis]|uniref:Uncharacterized protein n=1 Tax=Dryococelus australis TaxID=614101 RepID=A0ABQ9GAI0_9NEOP|nr:hypothetical protein PR048_028396 [Dryococelus australis]
MSVTMYCKLSRLMPQAEPSIKQDLETKQQKQKHYYGCQSRVLKPLQVGSPVRVRKGIGVNEDRLLKSYRVRVNTGYEVERNRRHIIKDTSHQPFVISGDLEEQEGNTQEIDNSEPIPITSANEKGQKTFNTEDGYSDNEHKGFRGFAESNDPSIGLDTEEERRYSQACREGNRFATQGKCARCGDRMEESQENLAVAAEVYRKR